MPAEKHFTTLVFISFEFLRYTFPAQQLVIYMCESQIWLKQEETSEKAVNGYHISLTSW